MSDKSDSIRVPSMSTASGMSAPTSPMLAALRLPIQAFVDRNDDNGPFMRTDYDATASPMGC